MQSKGKETEKIKHIIYVLRINLGAAVDLILYFACVTCRGFWLSSVLFWRLGLKEQCEVGKCQEPNLRKM